MADDAVTVEQLRKWYLDTLRASVLATDPVRVTAWTGFAAEIRAALGIVGVVEPVSAAPNPWRSVETLPAAHVAVLVSSGGLPVVAFVDDDGEWCTLSGARFRAAPNVRPPERWMPIPPVSP